MAPPAFAIFRRPTDRGLDDRRERGSDRSRWHADEKADSDRPPAGGPYADSGRIFSYPKLWSTSNTSLQVGNILPLDFLYSCIASINSISNDRDSRSVVMGSISRLLPFWLRFCAARCCVRAELR